MLHGGQSAAVSLSGVDAVGWANTVESGCLAILRRELGHKAKVLPPQYTGLAN